MSPELLQLLAGVAGAFVGGLLLVWRTSRRLPGLLNNIVAVVTSAVSHMLMDNVKEAVRAEVRPLAEKVEAHDRQLIDLMAERQRRAKP